MTNARRMKGPTRKDDASPKTCKAKRLANTVKAPTIPTTFDEAKAAIKARKRKERQESISSLYQERKVIRSNSEERPTQKKHVEIVDSIRRVSSSEDFQSQRSTSSERNASPYRGGTSDKILLYEDCEHEKRRSHERFARPLTLKSRKHPNKRLKVKYFPRTKYKPEPPIENREPKKATPPVISKTTDYEPPSDFLQIHGHDRGRSPSPTEELVSPVVDWSTIHELVDGSEPVLAQTSRQISENTETMPGLSVALNRLLSSPRNSIIATHKIYLDPDVPKTTSDLDKKPQNPVDERLHKTAKKINSLKKKIKKCEADFEVKHGYLPSHTDKMNDKNLKKLYADINKLKKEQKHLAEISSSCSLLMNAGEKSEQLSLVSLQITISEIEKKLTAKREAANRSFNIEEMSAEQLMEEKIAVQKALLFLESIHGRPNSREDRDIVRPFYDRYRTLKRKISANNPSGAELATIHENETMNFVTPTSSSQSNDTESEKTTVPPSMSTDSSDSDSSVGENLHSLSKSEMIEQLKLAMEEKKRLKRKIKEFEMNIQLKTGKMIQKEERAPMESIYAAYKNAKAKARLLEALVGKQGSV
ncbi:protein FAM13C isoform X2 [Leptinotarsa decemlineata]|uniref:protein FAM13C isoform X2 n=1 Tax=Leptinotarsa decemlineata TaxID=7539 RepID=UPI003D30CCD1